MSSQGKSFAFGSWTLNEILDDPRPELKDALFLIPDYQRGYAWEERQLEEFWEDLTSDKERHYMGALTVERRDKISTRPAYDVVDGQQRITTISLLLSTLGKAIDNPLFTQTDDGNSRFDYTDSNENRKFFRFLLENPVVEPSTESDSFAGVSSFLPSPENRSQKNLLFAKDFLSRHVMEKTGNDEELKKKLANSVFQKLVFDFRVLDNDDDANMIFETMNNRGKPLTLLEKLKNRLMYLSEIIGNNDGVDEDEMLDSENNNLRELIDSVCGEIYRVLAANPNKPPLDEDEFIAAHLSVYRNPEESVFSENVAASRLFKMFCEHPERHPLAENIDERDPNAMAKAEKEGELSPKKIKDFVSDLREFAKAWSEIHQECSSACGQCRLLSDRRETKIFLAAVARHVKDVQLRENIYDATRQILFRNTIGAGMDRTRFATLARRLHGICVHQLKRGQRTQLYGKDVLTELQNVLDDKRKKPIAQTLIEFFADKKKGNFYSWSELGLRYFLMRHEADYPGCTDGTPRLTWEMFEKVSIEHILPQSVADKDSRGRRWWNGVVLDWNKQVGGGHLTDAQLQDAAEMLSGTLGNLVLLTRKENSEVSSRAWESYPNHPGKREFYLDSIHHRSSNGAAALAAETESWNAWRIRNRGHKLFRQLAVDFGVTDCLLNSDVDKALGFNPIEVGNLSDQSIPLLTDAEVATNVWIDEEDEKACRQGNVTPSSECAKKFWKDFQLWCRNNDKQSFGWREPGRGGMKHTLKIGQELNNDYILQFKYSSKKNIICVEIYLPGNDVFIKDQTMNRLLAFRGEIDSCFESGVDCRWNDQREPTARVIRFRRVCDIGTTMDDTYRLMVSDAERLVEVLRNHGEKIR